MANPKLFTFTEKRQTVNGKRQMRRNHSHVLTSAVCRKLARVLISLMSTMATVTWLHL